MIHRVSFCLCLLLACSAPREPEATDSEATRPSPEIARPAPETSAAPISPGVSGEPPPPGPAASTMLDLSVAGYEPALVVTPSVDGPAPVVVVTHGAGGSAEPHCARYAALAQGKGFVLCTRGRPMDKLLPPDQRGYFYDGHHELGREVIAALAALTAKFGARVDPQGIVYAGYSQGAAMGILYLQQGGAAAAHVGRILLVEGGAGDWTIGLAAKLKKEGVLKAAIVCGQLRCRQSAKRSLLWMQKAGLDARISHAAGAGHTYGAAVAPLVDEAWAWLTEDDARWRR